MDPQSPPQELPPELAELAGLAAAADAELLGASLPPGMEPAPAADKGAELGAMLQMGVLMAAPALPFLPSCYTPDVCGQIGIAFAAVAEKYGWNLDGISSPELALAVVTVPATVQAVILGREYFKTKREQEAAAARAAQPPSTRPQGQAGQVMAAGDTWEDAKPFAGVRQQPGGA
nr:hypothetical protein [uncultured Roseateles sp.]